jgi:O-antigen/teichoic acid export membrane protein
MNGRFSAFRASGNPVVQILSVVVVAVALIGAVLMGAVLLAIALGVAAVLAAVFAVRLWWFQRKLKKQPPSGFQQHAGPRAPGGYIEAEYTVVSERKISRDGD